jgi:hypothetical protein
VFNRARAEMELKMHTSDTPTDPSAQAHADHDFDWLRDADDVVVREQRATAVYINPHGEIVIRQERLWDQEEDPFVVVAAGRVPCVIAALHEALRRLEEGFVATPLPAAPPPPTEAPSIVAAPSCQPSNVEKRARVIAALNDNPNDSDRTIAKATGVSHTYVHNLRHEGGNVSTSDAGNVSTNERKATPSPVLG